MSISSIVLRRPRLMEVLCGIIIALILSASVAEAAGKFGAKVGLVIADQTYSYSNEWGEIDRDSKTGVVFGLFTDYQFIAGIAIRPEFQYVQKGCKDEVLETTEAYPEGIGTLKIVDHVDYLSIPVMLKIGLPGGVQSLYLVAGPRLDIKLRTKSDFNSFVMDKFESTVFGATFGVGKQFSFGPLPAVLVEFNYYHDFSDAYKGDVLTIKNKGFALVAGVVL